MVQIDENLGDDAIEKVDMAVKVLDTLIFNKIKTDYTLRASKASIGLRDFELKIWVHIDLDRMYVKSPTYDDKYKDNVQEIESKIYNTLRYVGLHNYLSGVYFTYVNDDYVIDEIKKLNDILTSILILEYKITKKQIIYNYINYHLYLSDNEHPTVLIDFVGLEIEGEEGKILLDCDDLFDIMKALYDDSPLSESFDYENELCN